MRVRRQDTWPLAIAPCLCQYGISQTQASALEEMGPMKCCLLRISSMLHATEPELLCKAHPDPNAVGLIATACAGC